MGFYLKNMQHEGNQEMKIPFMKRNPSTSFGVIYSSDHFKQFYSYSIPRSILDEETLVRKIGQNERSLIAWIQPMKNTHVFEIFEIVKKL